MIATSLQPNGSSPRVRGTPCVRSASSASVRFIPACAGNTLTLTASKSFATVHPRVCGEHPPPAANTCGISGSSPRVRGTRHLVDPPLQGLRFIPACAGNTAASAGRGATGTVHPRVCGEHYAKKRDTPVLLGSSPRVRGTLRQEARHSGAARFIPACAGNTKDCLASLSFVPVHPRVCGEHISHKERKGE